MQFLLCSILACLTLLSFALLCLGFSLAQPELFARIYTSFPFGLTSPLSSAPLSPLSVNPLPLCIRLCFVLLVVALQLRKNAGITFFRFSIAHFCALQAPARRVALTARVAMAPINKGNGRNASSLSWHMKFEICQEDLSLVWLDWLHWEVI